MKYDPEVHHRRSIRLPGYEYSRAGTYFVTVCTQKKEFLLGEVVEGEMKANQYGEIVSLYWHYLPKRYPHVQLDSFAVMPNHIHGIITIAGTVHKPPPTGAIRELPLQRRNMLLAKIIGYFKMHTGKRINQIRGTPGAPVWQRNYYEHIIRNEGELNKIREYIETNPLRWLSDPENPGGDVGAVHEPPPREKLT